MGKAAARRLVFTLSTEGVTRLLISSYFVGLGLGIVDGADVGVLARPFLNVPASEIISGTIVVVLAMMVLFGLRRRPAALLLSLIVFWASYLTMVVESGSDHIGPFWRDLALIGALLLTYGDGRNTITIDPAATFAKLGGRTGATPRVARSKSRIVSRKPTATVQTKRARSELYREDFEVVRVS